MQALEHWKDILGPCPSRGVSYLKEECERDYSHTNIRELGLAYLWLRRFDEAVEHFERAIEAHVNFSSSSLFTFRGVAEWGMNRGPKAVSSWREALGAMYGDSGGANAQPALLLFFAAVVAPGLVPANEVRALLSKKAADTRGRASWPAPIAAYVIGETDEMDVCPSSTPRSAALTRSQHWQVKFYRGLLAKQRGQVSTFDMVMRGAVDEVVDARNSLIDFIDYIWHEEFFLARQQVEG